MGPLAFPHMRLELSMLEDDAEASTLQEVKHHATTHPLSPQFYSPSPSGTQQNPPAKESAVISELGCHTAGAGH